MTRGEAFVEELRTWIGTPFHEQMSAKGAGCDCKGLLWGAMKELDYPEAVEDCIAFIHYDLKVSNGLPHEHLLNSLIQVFDRVTDEPQIGDILLCKVGGLPGHLAVLSSPDAAIHTQLGRRAYVKETALRVLLAGYPLHSAWRWRDAA